MIEKNLFEFHNMNSRSMHASLQFLSLAWQLDNNYMLSYITAILYQNTRNHFTLNYK